MNRLVCFEVLGASEPAGLRETQLKRWRREWKVQLIEQDNPEWDDLWDPLRS